MGEVKQISTVRPQIYRDQLVTITDLQKLKEELLLSMSHLILKNIQKPSKRWLKSVEVYSLFGICKGTLENWRKQEGLPFTRIGHIYYYDQDAINKIFVEKQKLYGRGIIPPKKKRTG